jgi:peptide/nickel transport system permease protein
MGRFLTQRLLETVVVLAVMSFVIYALIGLMPGDPVDVMINANPNLTTEDAARLRALYGLDQPLLARYWNWLSGALSGDLGYSRLHARPVLAVLLPHLGRTLILMSIAFVLSIVIALPLGIYAASRPYSRTDYAINLFAFAGKSVPPFWFALLMILIFAVTLQWLPAGGLPTGEGADAAEWARYLILPAATLTILGLATYVRFMRSEMIGVLRQDYIRTAKAKGASQRRILYRHALRNAMIPTITVMALDFGALFSGALITETVFSYPGMGKLIFDAVMGNDYNLALTGLLFATLLVMIANFAADAAYSLVDPRISL